MAAKAKKKEEEDKLPFDQQLTELYFKANKKFHYNYEEFRGDYKVSTGSKIFDDITGGGFGSGLFRFVGGTESGKTSEALELQQNFLETVSDSKGIYVKAEGRLSDGVKERTRLKFVHDPKDWTNGTTLVFECNIYETVFDWLRKLILENPEKKEGPPTRYHIIIDSMDGLLPTAALDKSTADAAKVAAGAVMTSDFLKRTNLSMAKKGHQCIIMAQNRATIQINQYAGVDKNKLGGASGGNAAVHFSDWIVEFLRPNQSDMILPKEGPISVTNRPIGRMAKVKIHKSTNDMSMITAAYPIKFGRKHGKSIWVEREIIDLLVQWGYFEKKGSWYNNNESLPFEMKAQGIDKLYGLLEKDEELTKELDIFCKENILNQ